MRSPMNPRGNLPSALCGRCLPPTHLAGGGRTLSVGRALCFLARDERSNALRSTPIAPRHAETGRSPAPVARRLRSDCPRTGGSGCTDDACQRPGAAQRALLHLHRDQVPRTGNGRGHRPQAPPARPEGLHRSAGTSTCSPSPAAARTAPLAPASCAAGPRRARGRPSTG